MPRFLVPVADLQRPSTETPSIQVSRTDRVAQAH